MATSELKSIEQDERALAIARCMVIANAALTRQGADPAAFFVRIDEDVAQGNHVWEVHYIPRNYLHQRGGGFSVVVDEAAGTVRKLTRTQ